MINVFVENLKNMPLEHQYNLHVDGDSCRLEYIKSEEPIYNTTSTLIDDGNCIIINVDDRSFALEYHEAEQVLIMLAQNNTTKINFVENKIIKSI
jgi:hypothetical protein